MESMERMVPRSSMVSTCRRTRGTANAVASITPIQKLPMFSAVLWMEWGVVDGGGRGLWVMNEKEEARREARNGKYRI